MPGKSIKTGLDLGGEKVVENIEGSLPGGGSVGGIGRADVMQEDNGRKRARDSQGSRKSVEKTENV